MEHLRSSSQIRTQLTPQPVSVICSQYEIHHITTAVATPRANDKWKD